MCGSEVCKNSALTDRPLFWMIPDLSLALSDGFPQWAPRAQPASQRPACSLAWEVRGLITPSSSASQHHRGLLCCPALRALSLFMKLCCHSNPPGHIPEVPAPQPKYRQEETATAAVFTAPLFLSPASRLPLL